MEPYTIDFIEKNEISSWIQTINNDYKVRFSEVFTPFEISEEMISLIPKEVISNSSTQYLDAGCGCGYITMVLYRYIYNHKSTGQSRTDILNNIHIVDINKDRVDSLIHILPIKNVYHCDFAKFTHPSKYDVIVSNPPFIVHTPLKHTIWPLFVKQCIYSLKDNGYLCMILPSIWLKPQHDMYEYITSFEIHYIKCFNNNEANKLFNGDARTPLCYLLLQKRKGSGTINVWDNTIKQYTLFKLDNIPVPMHVPYLVNRILPFTNQFGSLQDIIIKTNCPKKHVSYSSCENESHPYKNIRTCKIGKNGPNLVIDYSNVALKYFGKRKLVLANKMYGIPYYDKNGEYGISTRDNYIYINDSDEECMKMFNYLNCKFILLMYESTRYRMSYLEKYALELIPNILNIPIEDVNNITINDYFQFTCRDIEIIDTFCKPLRLKSFKIDSK